MRTFSVLLTALTLTFVSVCEASDKEKSESHGDPHGKAHWTYTGENGPANWAKKGFLADGVGQHQSPINIPSTTACCDKRVEISYKASKLSLVNNGHAIKASYDHGSSITVDGKVYNLLQFHFHSPTEHSIDGKLLDLEMHLVHQSADGGLAVIGVLFKEGKANPKYDAIIKNMPAEAGKKNETGLEIDVSSLLPTDMAYYRYNGSLTTPPGTEGVKWHVLKKICELSKEQIDAFKKLYSGNNRPVQPMNERSFIQ